MNLSLPACWLLSCYSWHRKNRVNTQIHSRIKTSFAVQLFFSLHKYTHTFFSGMKTLFRLPCSSVFTLGLIPPPPPSPLWCVVSNSSIFMCRWSRSCHWSGLLVKLTLIIFSRTSLVWTERAQSTAGRGGGGGGRWVCLSRYGMLLSTLFTTVSILARYSEIWRKATCFNIYGCGRTWSPLQIIQALQYAWAHRLGWGGGGYQVNQLD